MAVLKTGDRVRLVTREATAEDDKSGLYRAYFGGLCGTVDRLYDDDSVCVEIEAESLPQDIRERHLAIQESERRRWLDGLSGEVRSRLSAEQRQLTMSYRVLVNRKDVEPIKGGSPTGTTSSGSSPAAHSTQPASSDKADSAESPESKADPPAGQTADESDAESGQRISEAELNRAEEEYLRSLRDKS